MFGIIGLCLGVLSATLHSLDSEGQSVRSISASTVLNHGCTAGFAVVSFYELAGRQ